MDSCWNRIRTDQEEDDYANSSRVSAESTTKTLRSTPMRTVSSTTAIRRKPSLSSTRESVTVRCSSSPSMPMRTARSMAAHPQPRRPRRRPCHRRRQPAIQRLQQRARRPRHRPRRQNLRLHDRRRPPCLQAFDVETRQLNHRREALEQRTKLDEALAEQARRQVEIDTIAAARLEVSSRQKKAEADAQLVSDKADADESKLYGGEVTGLRISRRCSTRSPCCESGRAASRTSPSRR